MRVTISLPEYQVAYYQEQFDLLYGELEVSQRRLERERDKSAYHAWLITQQEVEYRTRQLNRADRALRYWKGRYGL